ncbi:MAG: hypothetical protein HRU09_14410 [Oligoflexales bacterium]|nr:hypothetical protein [Oligoflexales bacterium]
MVLVLSLRAQASEFSFGFDEDLNKSEFESLAENLVTPLRFQFMPLVKKPLSFGASYRQSALEGDNKSLIENKSSQSVPESANSFSLMASSVPLGLTYAQLGYNGFHFWGVGFRSIIPAGGITLALRGGYTYLVENEQFCAPSINGEVLAHFQLPLIKPFVGLGVSQHKASYTPTGALEDHEHFWKDYYFLGGARLNLPGPISIGAELNASDRNRSLSLTGMFSI